MTPDPNPQIKAYKDTLAVYPCYGHGEAMSSKQWWRIAVKAALDNTMSATATGGGGGVAGGGGGAGTPHIHPCSEADFERFFRRIYQHYGSPEGYSILSDVLPFLEYVVTLQYIYIHHTPIQIINKHRHRNQHHHRHQHQTSKH